ncbi:glucose-6-phosphate isomerase [Pelagibacteraceae bacterium]|jgi:glucose-6-phosphate isomerase|nr:glucose-6-phosphate isomerase [Pelagibacteraceae bacterium]
MFKKNNFFNGYFINSNKYNKNLKKTKKVFYSFLSDLNNSEIPLLKAFEKKYEFDFSKEIIKKFLKYKNIIIIGMGGSILGTKSIYSFFKKKIRKEVFFFDNLDPSIETEIKKIKNFKSSCFVVVSKSGNTLETINNLNLFYSKILLKNKLVIITELKNSKLIKLANKLNADVIEHKSFIGGRYSVLSEVGMFPALLMNLNIKKFKDLTKLIKNKNFTSSLIKNVASIFTLNELGIKNSVILNYDLRLNDLCLWHQQLIAESLGKNKKGITPSISTCPKDHHSLMQLYLDGPQDKFFTFFSSAPNKSKKIEFVIDAQCQATKNIFKTNKIPSRQFLFKKNNEGELGSIFTFFVLETILLARLMNINPYTQPAVEQIKIETNKYLKL